MQLTVQGKQMDVGDSLRVHVEEKIDEINKKFFNRAVGASVTFAKEGHGHGLTRAAISLRVGKSINVLAEVSAADAYAAFDSAAEKVAKQLRRYKNRLRDHHERIEQTPETEIQKARDYVLAHSAGDDESEDEAHLNGDDPVVIAEMTTDIQTLSVSDAVMRLDLGNLNALLFRNAKNNELNLIYRRPDGNIGWIDPEISQQAEQLQKAARRA